MIKIYGFSITVSNVSALLTKYALTYPLSNSIPSVYSTSSLKPFASSTVITPSFPTLSKTPAIISPKSLSLFVEIVATCEISSFVVIFLAFFDNSPKIISVPLSKPLLREIGFAPAATFLKPTFAMACAKTVTVVVPSPANSFTLFEASLIISTPTFLNGSFSSISFATVTPSFVTTCEPNDLAIATFLPLGPNVTFTAFAIVSTPSFKDFLASSLYIIAFDIFVRIKN